MPELAPSAGLRRWYEQHRQWELFRSRYLVELLTGPGTPLLELARRVREGPLTLLSATRAPTPPPRWWRRWWLTWWSRRPRAFSGGASAAWRATLPAETAAAWSRQIHRILTGRALWREARGVLLYLSVGREVATGPLVEAALREGRPLFAPKVDRRRRQLLLGRVADPAAESGSRPLPGHPRTSHGPAPGGGGPGDRPGSGPRPRLRPPWPPGGLRGGVLRPAPGPAPCRHPPGGPALTRASWCPAVPPGPQTSPWTAWSARHGWLHPGPPGGQDEFGPAAENGGGGGTQYGSPSLPVRRFWAP